MFHPLLLPTFLFAVVLYYLPASAITFPRESRWVILIFVFMTTFVVPATGTWFLYRFGRVRSLSLTERTERGYPLFLTTICYAITSFLFYRQDVFDRLFFFVMGVITLLVFLTYLFSLLRKISAHSVGAGGALGLLVVLNALLPENHLVHLIVLYIIVAGAVMSARLALDAHTSGEVYGGFILGFFSSLGAGLVQ